MAPSSSARGALNCWGADRRARRACYRARVAEETARGIWSELTTNRARVADIVFAHLARAILHGEIAAGDTLPAERDLADRYAVSRVLVREAVHKLKDLGLVRVKPGGQTVVLDPAESSDPRIVSLELELGDPTPSVRRELTEKLLTHAGTLLELGSGRMAKAALESLDADADALAKTTDAKREEIVTRWWMTVARATKNTLLLRETRFWLGLGARGGTIACLWRIEDRDGHALYKKITARLRKGEDASGTWLRAVRPSLER